MASRAVMVVSLVLFLGFPFAADEEDAERDTRLGH
jgi:hypothetical protein